MTRSLYRPQSRLMLLVPLALLAGCGTLPTPSPATADRVPALPVEARQTDSPTFSRKASSDIERWLRLLTEPSSQDKPVRPATTP